MMIHFWHFSPPRNYVVHTKGYVLALHFAVTGQLLLCSEEAHSFSVAEVYILYVMRIDHVARNSDGFKKIQEITHKHYILYMIVL